MSTRAPRQDDFQLHGGKPQQWCLRRAQTYRSISPTTQDCLRVRVHGLRGQHSHRPGSRGDIGVVAQFVRSFNRHGMTPKCGLTIVAD